MRNILIVADSASSFSLEEAKELGIAILPLSVIIEKDVYQDMIGIDTEAVYEAIRAGKAVSTSQVNIGYIEEKLREWKDQYDEIIIVTLPKSLSGTYSTIDLVVKQLQMEHVHVFDANNLAGIQQMVAKLFLERSKDCSFAEIAEAATTFSAHTATLIIPQTLDQLKKGGRISAAAAMMATLLKIKPVLKLVNDGQTIDKYAVAKTDKKVNEIILQEIAALQIPDQELEVYLLHADHRKRIEEVEILVKTVYPNSSIHVIDLPPVLVAHAGMGCIAMQAGRKLSKL